MLPCPPTSTPLSLHDALPIYGEAGASAAGLCRRLEPPQAPGRSRSRDARRSEEHTSELQSLTNLVCRLLLEKKNRLSRSARRRSRGVRLSSHRSAWPTGVEGV